MLQSGSTMFPGIVVLGTHLVPGRIKDLDRTAPDAAGAAATHALGTGESRAKESLDRGAGSVGDRLSAGTALCDHLAGSALAREVERVSVGETGEEKRLAIALDGSASVLSRHTGAYDLKRVAEGQGGEERAVLVGILVVIFSAVAGSTGGTGSTAAGDLDGAAEAEGLSVKTGL